LHFSKTEEETVNQVRIISALFFLAVTSTAFAHPGHPSLSPYHEQAGSALDPVSLVLFGVAVAGVFIVARIGKRTCRGRADKKS